VTSHTPLLVRNSAIGLLAGALMGAVWALAPMGVAALVTACLAALACWAMISGPAWTLGIFWLAYCLQSTIFANQFSIKGAFYPLYLLILLNTLLFLFRPRNNPLEDAGVFRFAAAMAFFLLVAAAGVYRADRDMPEYPFAVYQRLFLYSMGILATLQFWMDSRRRRFVWIQIGASLMLAGWVIRRATESGFGYRGGTGVNENYVAEIVAVGLVALFAGLTGNEECRGLVKRLALWAGLVGGVYALMLLASRGMFVGFAVASAAVLLWRARSVTTVLAVVAAVALATLALTHLPGTEGLLQRFESTNVYTFNERLYIWRLVIGAILDGSAPQLLIGHGLGTTTSLINSSFSVYNSTHNVYLQLFYEFGLLGLCAFLAAHLLPLSRLVMRRDLEAISGGAMLIFMMICGLTGTEADNPQYWIVLGYAAAVAYSPAPAPLVFYRLTRKSHALTLACDHK